MMIKLHIFLLSLFISTCLCSDITIDSKSHCSETKNISNKKLTFNNYGYSITSPNKDFIFIVEDLFMKHVPLDSAVVDIGCGFGANAYGVSQCGYKNIYAIDLDPNNFKDIECQYQSIKFIPGLFPSSEVIESLPENNWGIVLSINVFHFMKDEEIDNSLKIIFEKLRSPGFLICKFLRCSKEGDLNNQDNEKLNHYIYVDSQKFKEKLERIGYKIRQYTDSQELDSDQYVTMAIVFKGEWQS